MKVETLTWLLVGITLLVGSVTPIQAGINSSLGKLLREPLHAAFISFLGGLLTIIIFCILTGKMFPSLSSVKMVPLLLLSGGIFGALFVFTGVIVAPRLGATLFIAAVLSGQLMASIILDHFGILGYTQHPLTFMRLFGVILLLLGVFIVKTF